MMSEDKINEMIEGGTSELYSVVETIENGSMLVTACRELWIKGQILYWPPGEVDRQSLIQPEPNWIPHMCRILASSIGTF